MADDRLLEGVDIFVMFPTDGANVDTLSADDGFLFRGGSESSCLDAGIWASCFPAPRCLDGLSDTLSEA